MNNTVYEKHQSGRSSVFGFIKRKPFIVEHMPSRGLSAESARNVGFSEFTLWLQCTPISLIIVLNRHLWH